MRNQTKAKLNNEIANVMRIKNRISIQHAGMNVQKQKQRRTLQTEKNSEFNQLHRIFDGNNEEN